ncbi:MAG: hypothetical protein ISS70_25190 [Phycisphaerae bacterium]|nr:hypothetical protein [Phycisphaerae bacterium]
MMVSTDLTDRIFLGRGGARPGVVAIQDDISHSEWFAELAPGESVYALDANIEAKTLAFGTRAGKIYVRQWPDDDSAACQEWLQGAPVLSVCWLGRSLLCSSDSSGKCLLWPLATPDQPKSLETDGRVVCAFARVAHGELVGLASDGCLLFWALPGGDLLRYVEGPRPASKLGLVNLRYWPRRDVLLYPTEDGQLCGFRLGATECQCVKAHRGTHRCAARCCLRPRGVGFVLVCSVLAAWPAPNGRGSAHSQNTVFSGLRVRFRASPFTSLHLLLLLSVNYLQVVSTTERLTTPYSGCGSKRRTYWPPPRPTTSRSNWTA